MVGGDYQAFQEMFDSLFTPPSVTEVPQNIPSTRKKSDLEEKTLFRSVLTSVRLNLKIHAKKGKKSFLN